jgi:uncharacterized protein YhdP
MALNPLLQTRWLRGSLIAGIALASFASALAIAYELALSRVPRHRAALESLVRGQTGLDIRFNELSLRVGWYGPEAVFRRVELGEPGRSNVLLRAPQLIVGINAWQTVRTGRLAAGRITLIAPDIDLERLTRSPPGETAGAAPSPSGGGARLRQAHVLDRWKGGVIDLQGGTLRLPDPGGTASALTLQIRRAALRRAGNEWSGHALVFLPERLGRTARVVAQLTGDINTPSSLSGGFRFEGVRLSFASWRSVLGDLPQVARNLPLSGAGDVTVDLTLKNGRVEKADGELRAIDLAVGAPSWLEPMQASRSALKLDYVTGNWRFLRRETVSQFQVEQLVLSREQRESPLPRFTVEVSAGHLHSSLKSAPLISVAAVAGWLAPELVAGGVVLEGTVEDIDVDWNPARPEGFRLAASARVDDASADSIPHGFTLKRLPVHIQATERRVALEMDAPAAWLRFASDPQQPLDALKLVSRMSIARLGSGWQVQIPRLSFHDASAAGELSGTVTADAPEKAPLIDLQGTVAHADVARLQTWFANGVTRVFGSGGMRIGAGRIESGAFEVQGRADDVFTAGTAGFNGSFNLRDAQVPSGGTWPEMQALNARVEWAGSRVRASVAEGRAGEFDLESVEAEWDAAGVRTSRVTGRAHGRLEQALAWMRSHPDLQQNAPHLQDIVARGDAVFDFDVTVPAAASVVPPASPRPRARLSTVLEDVQFTLAPDLPPVESLRGVLAYDNGRLQRSTLSATWLGGPLTLKIAERRGASLSVQAQGFVDAQKLVALSKIRHLAEVSGETSWTGEFVYTPPAGATAARWQGRADSNLVGIASELPAPLAKNASAALPLHVEITGVGDKSELRANLSDRLRAAFALNIVNREDWLIERGAIRLGGGPAMLPAEDIIQVRGRVRRLDVPAYVLAWQQLRKGSPDSHADIDLSADALVFGDRVYADASVQARAAGEPADATALRIEAPTLGVLTGTLLPGAGELAFSELQLKKRALTGTGSLRCAADLATCRSEFALNTADTAATLADLGFRADLSAAKGALSGEIAWKPRQGRPWLESAAGTLSMRFEEGVARQLDASPERPFPLFSVPALLGGISRHPSAAAGTAPPVESGELRFKRLEANFQLRDGQATTSDLHFDGDAEILVRGRIGLLAHDYDHEAWVLRGEERIPASMRRLASAPRVAAAWLTLRELLGGEDAGRSRIVLRLRGSWDEPVVSVE